MDLIDYIYDECHRQHVTNYGDFANGWDHAVWHADKRWIESPERLSAFVQYVARYVEPEKNRITAKGNLRTSHVGFLHGGSAALVNEVRPRFERWCEQTWSTVVDNMVVKTIGPEILNPEFVDILIKQLLDIHPWVDANGRTASILRNWMLGTLDNPQPLPYYFGE